MTTPAENAATVREALDVLYHYTSDQSNPPGNGRSETWAEGLAAVRALLAQAETAGHVRQGLNAAAADAEAAEEWLGNETRRRQAAEAERDAAVRAAEHAQEALRLMAVDFAPDLKIHDPEILATEYMHRAALTGGVDDPCDDTHRFAHGLNHPCNCGEHETWAAWAALTGEGTE